MLYQNSECLPILSRGNSDIIQLGILGNPSGCDTTTVADKYHLEAGLYPDTLGLGEITVIGGNAGAMPPAGSWDRAPGQGVAAFLLPMQLIFSERELQFKIGAKVPKSVTLNVFERRNGRYIALFQ